MSTVLSTYSGSRDNNFNLIRFIAALSVLYSHSFALTLGSPHAEPLRNTIGTSLGTIAVDVFFITSGFLIASSYFSRNNLLFFAWARILRIYPALIVATLFCVFVVGLTFTTLPAWEYLSSGQTLKFSLKNSSLLFGVEGALPGVFANIPWKTNVNGSLWTLPYEIAMYILLAIILFTLGHIQKRLNIGSLKYYLLLIAVTAVILNIINHADQLKFASSSYILSALIHITHQYIRPFASDTFIHLFSMFFTGAAYYAWQGHIRLSSAAFILMSILLLWVANFHVTYFFILYAVFLPYLTLCVAYTPLEWAKKFNNVGDYSYGLYIYAFPVQQSISAMIPDLSVATMVAVSLVVTLMLAFLSWHLIEKRFLKMKGSYAAFEQLARRIRHAW